MSEDPPYAELCWGAYLASEYDLGNIKAGDDIASIKERFMAGMRGEEHDG